MMSSVGFPTLTIASVLASAALWSCNKEDPPEPAEQTRPQTQEQTSPPMPAAGGGMMQELRAGCPMVVEGADVAVSDTEGGVTLTFTTEAGDVADLRARVQHMAEMYEMHGGRRGMMWHHMGGQGRGRGGPGMGMGHMAGRGPMPAATVTGTEVDKGARLELRPTDASQLDALREHVRWHQQRMEAGECWMLQGQGKAPEGGDK
jgi:hypothetical protein